MNILITGAWKGTPAQFDEIRSMGHTVVEMSDERAALPCGYAEVDAVICNGLFLHHPIERFTALRYIQLTSAGLDRVPLEYVRQHGITLCNARGVYSAPMAEFAVAAMLYFYKQLPLFAANRSKRHWEKCRAVRELVGKTVCIVGCGSVGNACAERFGALGCRVTGVDVSPREDVRYEKMYPTAALLEALACTDAVVLTVPLTEQTQYLIDAAALAALRDGCVLVNIARGAVIETESLIAALSERRLYAALDVFEQEPLGEDSPLWDMENVLITPHNSFVGDGNAERMWAVIRENLRKI